MNATPPLAGIPLPRCLHAALLLLLLLWGGPVQAQEATEYELKAAFLYNFASYVQWPPGIFNDPGQAVVFGVVGANELADNLEQVTGGRAVNGRAVEVRRLRGADELAGIHVLFAGDPLGAADRALLAAALQSSILTVTESDGARPDDSVINFEIVDGRVRFDVSLTEAGRARLQVSSRLLQVALRVLGENP